MLIEFPLIYDCEVIARRRRDRERLHIVETIPIDIPVVRPEEAPAVASAQAEAIGNPRLGSFLSPITYRSYGGLILRPLACGITPAGAGTAYLPALHYEPTPISNLQRDIVSWMNIITSPIYAGDFFPCDLVPERNEVYAHRRVRAADVDVRRYMSDTRDGAEATLRRKMRDASIIDGFLYIPSAGPALHATVIFGMSGNSMAPVITAVAEAFEVFLTRAGRSFHPDQLADAEKWVLECVAEGMESSPPCERRNNGRPAVLPLEHRGSVDCPARLYAPAFSGEGAIRNALRSTRLMLGRWFFDGRGMPVELLCDALSAALDNGDMTAAVDTARNLSVCLSESPPEHWAGRRGENPIDVVLNGISRLHTSIGNITQIDRDHKMAKPLKI